MKSFIFLVTFLSSTILFADTVTLSSFEEKVTGEVTITNTDFADVSYHLSNTKLNQDYGIRVYEKGDCSNYSSPVIPMINSSEGIDTPIDSYKKEFLVFIKKESQTSDNGRIGGIATGTGRKITNVDFKGKVLVVEEVPGGKAVACGVYP